MARMYHIIVGGALLETVPAYSTPEEVQHELAQRTGKYVRVIEFIAEDKKEELFWREDD